MRSTCNWLWMASVSYTHLPEIKSNLNYSKSQLLNTICDEICDLSNLYDLIEKSITDDPPFTIKEGGVIKEGYSCLLYTSLHQLKILY